VLSLSKHKYRVSGWKLIRNAPFLSVGGVGLTRLSLSLYIYFIKEARNYIPEVQASVVALPGVPVERCREIEEKELGVKSRAREYNEVG